MQTSVLKYLTSQFGEVTKLWRSNSKTLGFLPMGAFEGYAKNGNIIIATDKNRVVGYLLSNPTRQLLSVVHLCIDPDFRGKGIARDLMNHLKELAKGTWPRIRVSCRRDFVENGVWQKLGFHIVAERDGKAGILDIWVFDFVSPTLFSNYEDTQIRNSISIALDSQVFYDIELESRPDREQSEILVQEWMLDEVTLCLTNEIETEIGRHEDAATRAKLRDKARTYKRVPEQPELYDRIFQDLSPLFPQPLSKEDESDLRHLARASAGGVSIFASRDKSLLLKRDQVVKSCGLLLLHPEEVPLHLHILENPSKFLPRPIGTTKFSTHEIRPEDIDEIVSTFLDRKEGERKKSLSALLRKASRSPDLYQSSCIKNEHGTYQGLLVNQYEKNLVVEIMTVRARPGVLREALILHMLEESRQIPAAKWAVQIINQDVLSDDIGPLDRLGFAHDKPNFVRFSGSMSGHPSKVSASLESSFPASHRYGQAALKISNELLRAMRDNSIRSLIEIEKSIRPARLLECQIENYILPIKPYWAKRLLSVPMPQGELIDNSPGLVLSRENVYYRSAQSNQKLICPARIIWYVSGADKPEDGAGMIWGLSYLDQVHVAKPKHLFSSYRRSGIYGWDEIFKLANKNLDEKVMALVFSYFDPFSSPISFSDLQNILVDGGMKPNQVQAPLRIPEGIFVKILEKGFNTT